MITSKTIEEYVEGRPSACREVFSRLVTTDDKKLLALMIDTAKEKLIPVANKEKVFTGDTWIKDMLESLTIEEFAIMTCAGAEKDLKNSLSAKITALFRPLSNKMIELAYGIRLNSLPIAQQAEAMEGMFWASIYLVCKDQIG